MKPKERILHALHHEEPDRVPTGENDVDYVLAEQLLGRTTLYNSRWRERQALWDGRRAEIVHDYGTTLVELARTLEWDYVRVPAMPVDKPYRRPAMTGPYSWLDETGREIQYSPEVGNVATYVDDPEKTVDDLPDPAAPFAVHPSVLEVIRHVVAALGDTHFIIGRSPVDGTFPFQQTVGMQELLMRMVTDPEFVRRRSRSMSIAPSPTSGPCWTQAATP